MKKFEFKVLFFIMFFIMILSLLSNVNALEKNIEDFNIGEYKDNLINFINFAENFNLEECTHSFVDVSENDKCYEAVQVLSSMGITNGVGDNKFAPNRNITRREFYTLVYNILDKDNFSEIISKTNIDNAIMYEVNKFGKYDNKLNITSNILNEYMKWSELNQVMVKILGVRTYSSDIDLPQNESFLTRGEAITGIYNIITDTPVFDEPDIINKVNINCEDSIYDLNSFLIELSKVPSEIISDFTERNWTYVVGRDYINNYNSENNMIAVGLCSYANKSIFVVNSGSTVHEFGHYLHFALGYPKEITELYNLEKEKLIDISRDYSAKNEKEFFADAFKLYIQSKNDFELKEKFKINAPLTCQYLENLENNNWGLNK